MCASASYNVWPRTHSTWESEAATEDDLDAFRGLLYSVAISLVFVWVPIGFIVLGTNVFAAGS
jgi:hypothetical protein